MLLKNSSGNVIFAPKMKFLSLYICLITVFFLFSCSGKPKQKKAAYIRTEDSLQKPNYFPEFPELTKDYFVATRAFANRFYKDQINKDQFSGTFLVAKNGKIIYERTSGFYNRSEKRKLNSEDPIHVASISKVATAIQILRYCDRGLIDLDADVRTYLPELPYQGVTVRMLLNHRSGLPYYGYFTFTTWHLGTTMKNQDVLDLMKKHRFRKYFPPGKKFAYCNTNYVLLALIAEKVSGKKFPVLMKEEIFDPLGMENTFIMDHQTNNKDVCQSYNSKNQLQKFNYLDAIYGDKNMYTTARDLLKLDRATYSNEFLSDSLKEQMFKGYSFEKRGIVNYGLGMRMYIQPKKEPFYFHTGWWHGNTGCYATLRSDTLCVIAIANKYTHTVYKVRNLTPYFGNYPADFTFE
jgi:CubicO group peptidase (beta-lactamase class C family)